MRLGAAAIASAVLALVAPVALHGCGGGDSGGGGDVDPDDSNVNVTGSLRLGADVGLGSYVGKEHDFASLRAAARDDTSSKLSSYIAFDTGGLLRDFSAIFGVSLPEEVVQTGGAFSGSVDYQRRREELTSFPSELTIRGEVFAVLVEKVAEISPAAFLAASGNGTLAEDLKSLPASYGSEAPFVAFFAAHGTHRLSELRLGGRLSLRFTARMLRNQTSDEVLNSFTRGAKGHLQQLLGLPSEMSVSASEVDLQRFESFSSFSNSGVETLGGDPAKASSWDEWRDTVAGQLAAVDHRYELWDDVLQELGRSENWAAEVVSNRTAAMRSGLAAYLLACPKACSAQGRCNFATRTCYCDQKFLGNTCEGRRCPQDCGGGTCDTTVGQCMCDDGFKHADPADNSSACATDCRAKRFVGGHPCKSCPGCYHTHNRRALETPLHEDHAKDRRYACLPLGARSVNDAPSVAGDLYCAEMEHRGLVGAGAIMTAFTTENPLCSWDLFHASWCRGFRIGNNHQVDIGCPGCTHPSEPDHEEVFSTITCTPTCADTTMPAIDVPPLSDLGQRSIESSNCTEMQIV